MKELKIVIIGGNEETHLTLTKHLKLNEKQVVVLLSDNQVDEEIKNMIRLGEHIEALEKLKDIRLSRLKSLLVDDVPPRKKPIPQTSPSVKSKRSKGKSSFDKQNRWR